SWMSRPYWSRRGTLFAVRYSLFASNSRHSFGEGRKAKSEVPLREVGVGRGKTIGRVADLLRLGVSFPSTGGMDVSLHTLSPIRMRHRHRNPGYAVRPRRSETVLLIIDAAAVSSSA